MNSWTDEQLKAIETRDCNLLVAAGAGAGKTAVLVERIIRRITDEENPIDIDSLLVVTFTNAAASEMRERVADAITKKLDENPHSKRLQNQLTLLNRANIITIHSFCLNVIRSNFHKIDLDPGFRIGDETETRLLKADALEELFEEKYGTEKDENFINLVESYGSSKDDLPLQDMVLDLYKFAISSEDPEGWLEKCTESFNINDDFIFSDSIWATAILNNAAINLKAGLKLMEAAVNIIKRTPELDAYLSQFEIELNDINEIYDMSKKSYRELHNALYSFTFERLKGNVKEADKDIKDKVQGLRKTVKEDIINPLKEELSLSNEEIKEQIKSIYPSIKTLCSLIMDFHRKYADKKKERGIIDFNDIEHFCLSILVENLQPSETAQIYREKFSEILIDEYQDSNYIQEAILTSISKDNPKNIFMVGDVKQSIYRFRNAKPELFLEKYNRYSDDEGDERRILLYKNFRSRGEVIDGVNYIFRQLMSENIGEMDYTDREKLNEGADYAYLDEENAEITGSVELNIIEREEKSISDSEEELEDEEFIGNIELEAIAIAKRIKELLGSNKKALKIFDKKENKYRNVEYRDIVILLRATSKWSDIFEEVLSLEGIPSFADTGVGYFDTIEIETIVSLLQIIDNPMQDIPLLGVLRSPIFSFTPDELIDIRMEKDQGTFYSALKNNEDSSVKIANFLKKLKSWQDKAEYMSTGELMWFLYSDTGYYGYAGAMPGGVQRQANLRILFERAREYEKTSYKGLFNFVNFIEKIKRSSGDMGSAKILGENENVVRIMSIHKSKGLEFPVVILAGCGKNFNKIDLRKKILYHHRLLLGPDFVDYKRRITSTTIIKEAIKRKINVETLSEEMRVLYVAITRAKEKLIIMGTVANIKKVALRWADTLSSSDIKLDEYDVLKAKSYIDWIGRCVIRHKDAEILRDMAGIEDYNSGFTDERSKWDIKLLKRDEILKDKKEDVRAKENIINEIMNMNIMEFESKYGDEIKRRLDYEYPYKIYTKLPAKLTVSEAKRIAEIYDMEEDAHNMFQKTVLKKPSFIDKKQKLLAPQIGTLVHRVMQNIDIKDNLDSENIALQIDRMVSKGIIDKNNVHYIDISKIEEFFKSELGSRMIKSSEVRREVPFHIQIPANEIYTELPNDIKDKIMLQGIIDCCFKEDDKFVIIDYKTDYVKNIDEIRLRYKVQIELYARALEEVTGIAVKNKYIYLMSTGDLIEY